MQLFCVFRTCAMNQYQSGLDGTCHEHSVAPHKLSLRAMKAECKLHVPNLLSAKVCLARLTPSQLPSNALEQYYKLSVKSRVNGYWSGCNGINKRNVLSPKQHKDIGRKLINTHYHRSISHVDLQTFPRTINHAFQGKMCSPQIHLNSLPVADLSLVASKSEQSQSNTTFRATVKVCIRPISPELKSLKSRKQPTKPSIPVQRSIKINQATGNSTSFQQTVSTLASKQASVCLTLCESDKHLAACVRAARSQLTSTTCNMAVKPFSTTPPAAVQPVRVGKAFLGMPSLNVHLSPISPDMLKVNHAISPALSQGQLRMPVCISSGPHAGASATSTARFKQYSSSTNPGKLYTSVPLKNDHLPDKAGSSESKGLSSLSWPSGAKLCSSVASVCLSPLRPDQLPSNARKQYEKQLVKKRTSKCVALKKKQKLSTEVKHKTSKQGKSTSNEHDSSRMCKKQKVPLQTRKDNFQPFGVETQKDRLTKSGRGIPRYIEAITETDSSESDEDENQPLVYLIGKKNKLISRTKAINKPAVNKSTKGVKRKAEPAEQARKKSRKKLYGWPLNCEKKPRKYKIPAQYCNIKFSQVSDITRIKTRYRVAFARWPHVFGGALDIINKRIASQNAIWNSL